MRVILLLLLLVNLGWAADVVVGTATARAGQKATGYIQRRSATEGR